MSPIAHSQVTDLYRFTFNQAKGTDVVVVPMYFLHSSPMLRQDILECFPMEILFEAMLA
jgi:hypothetical protein